MLVGGETGDRGAAGEAVGAHVANRKDALIIIRLRLAVDDRHIAVGAAGRGGEFPLLLARQCLARPARIGERVLIGDLHHRLAAPPVDIGVGPGGMAPLGSHDPAPPVGIAVGRRGEHSAAGHQHVRRRAGQLRRVALGERLVAGGLHEGGEFGVGHLVRRHPEAGDGGLLLGAFLGQMRIGAHGEGRAGNPDIILLRHRGTDRLRFRGDGIASPVAAGGEQTDRRQ